jgi:hypothetical protein
MGGIPAGRISDPYTTRGRVESLNAAFSRAPIFLKSVVVMITTLYSSAASPFQIGPSKTLSFVFSSISSHREEKEEKAKKEQRSIESF